MHIAIGESYPECYVEEGDAEKQKKIDELEQKGIFNKSSQHVDIVVDFREGGAGRRLFLDDQELISRNNIWEIS
ncbi:MAG: aminopeptidase [Candidatus Marinimicrobia bacterium]|nr:aminopeptidase [Candidatus Neomarinimicrobiota bacterium]